MSVKKYSIGQFRNGSAVLAPQERKTILFLSDLHLRPSGLGSQKKQIMYQTCHRYNFIDVGYIQNLQPNVQYNIQNISSKVQAQTGVPGASISILPYDIYNPQVVKKQKKLLELIDLYKPDALFHFTDPHSWYWMYQIQGFIRSKIPIIYYNIWDNLPYPKYNQRFYNCSDLIMNISKQTHNIVNQVCINTNRQPWQTKYVPHGINTDKFRPLGKNNAQFKRVYESIQRDNYDFILLFVNKNIIRKQASLIMQAWKWFVNNYLTQQQKKRVCLIMKTQVIYGPGMPLNIYQDEIIHDYDVNIRFISQPLSQSQLVSLYNCSDAIVSYSSAEGFGLSTAQGLACGKPFIAPVIGGLQDQMRFETQTGELYFNNPKVPSNCFKTYSKHANWVIPIWTTGLGSTGSQITPYIYQMYFDLKSLIQAMNQMYKLGSEQRQKRGLQGRQWLLSDQSNMSMSKMAELMVESIDTMFKYWTPTPNIRCFQGRTIYKHGNAGSCNPITKIWE